MNKFKNLYIHSNKFWLMRYYNVKGIRTFTIILISMMMIIVLYTELLSIPHNIYAQSINKDSTISTLKDLVNQLVTGVKLENIITVPHEVHVSGIFEVNATVINTLPFNITIIAGNCNSDFSTNFYNNVEEIMVPQCMNKILPTVLGPGDKVTVQETSGTGKQYKAVAEGKANGTAILSYSIEVKPEGFLQATSLDGKVIEPFSINILS